jgi:Ala-tRNA(Pro) deacylase
MNERAVYDRLAELGIAYRRHEHPPAATVEEAERHWADLDATHCKNLFLRNQKGDRHYLVVLVASKRADLRALAVQIGDGKLSFASPERLRDHLGLAPGSVSPFGLINDARHAVRVVIDREVRAAERVGFHPNVNTATLTISGSDFARFLESCGNPVQFVSV